MDQNWFYLIEQASDISKIIFSFIIYACCLNKTTKTINKLTNEQPSSHFFLTDPLSLLISRVPTVSLELLFWIPCKFFTRILVLIIAFSSCIMQMSAKIIKNQSFLPIFSIFLTLAVPTASWNPFFRIPCKFLRRYRSFSLNFLHKNGLFHANLCKNHGKSVNFADFFNFSHTCCFHSILGPIFLDSLRFFTWI